MASLSNLFRSTPLVFILLAFCPYLLNCQTAIASTGFIAGNNHKRQADDGQSGNPALDTRCCTTGSRDIFLLTAAGMVSPQAEQPASAPGDSGKFNYEVSDSRNLPVPSYQISGFRVWSPDERKAAVLELAAIGDKQSVEAILMAVTDKDYRVRQVAVKALDRLGEPLGRLIFQALEGSEDARHELASLRDARAIRPIVRSLDDWNPIRREAALETIIEMEDERTLDALNTTLNKGGTDAQAAAIKILTKLSSPQATDILISSARKRQPESVRVLIMYALGDVARTQAVDLLIDGLRDSSPYVREGAAYSLGSYNENRAVEPLITALSDDIPSVRKAAAWSLGSFADRKSRDPLLEALQSNNAPLREAAAYSLGKLRDREAVEPLMIALTDRYIYVRTAAAWSLGLLADPRAVDSLITAIQNDIAQVRNAAVASAAYIADSRIVAAALNSLGDENEKVRKMAWHSLEQSTESSAVLAVSMLNNTLNPDQVTALRENPKDLGILTGALSNRSREVRHAAAASLAAIEDKRVVNALIKMAGGWNLHDRIVATYALMNIHEKIFPNLFISVAKVLVQPASLVYFFILMVLLAAAYTLSMSRKAGHFRAQ